MNSQLLCQQDPTIMEFDARVVERLTLPDHRSGVVLDRTYFYPTGGGQGHDTGMIDSARVVDVFKDEQHNRLIHVVEGELDLGPAKASIDAERRLRAMQHHSAQHLLTQCILRQTGFETVSANINGYSPSTLDVIAASIDKNDLDQAEQMANQIVYDDVPVKTYFVSPEELASIPLRRPPRVTENIRIVEIDGFDYSPCGGTHVLRTGSIGLVKILKTDRQNDKLRVHFIAGLQAMELFHAMFGAINGLANKLSISWQDLPTVAEKQLDQLTSNRKELQELRLASLRYEAQDLVVNAEGRQGIRLVRASFEGRPSAELRLLADELKKNDHLVAYLSTFDWHKITLVVACGPNAKKDARQLLTAQLSSINGRGGGDASLAQGGGAATADQFRSFLQDVDLAR
jgi:alanyl-tRNA synthetase